MTTNNFPCHITVVIHDHSIKYIYICANSMHGYLPPASCLSHAPFYKMHTIPLVIKQVNKQNKQMGYHQHNSEMSKVAWIKLELDS